MPIGICKMCHQTKDLVRSHLIPASMYDYCRRGEHRPVRLGDGALIPTDRQTQDYLLCKECEDILNKGGEHWLADKLATWERAFPLYDLMVKQPAVFDEGDVLVYAAGQNPELRITEMVHFAMGVFWKSSVHSWKGGSKEPQIELGPYSDKIRAWLRGESGFPPHVYLVAAVSRPARAQIILTEPYQGTGGAWHTFFFHVPGLFFSLNVGKIVDEATRVTSLYPSAGHLIFVSDGLTENLEQLFAGKTREARKTQAYLRAMEKVAVARKKN